MFFLRKKSGGGRSGIFRKITIVITKITILISVKYIVRGQMAGKNILLIIDPQYDFTDKNREDQKAGRLSVKGAVDDYDRIIEFIKKHKMDLDEIHITLDTHTSNHIGHYGYWKVLEDPDGGGERDAEDATEQWSQVIYDKTNDKFIGTKTNPETKTTTKKTLTPKKTELIDYTKQYFENHGSVITDEKPKEEKPVMIWAEHCTEGSKGHTIDSKLKTELDLFASKQNKKVRYHIKGQNQLAEMYSIFKAEVPYDESKWNFERDLLYNGRNSTDMPYNLGEGCETYEEAITKVNLSTELNTALLNNLLGQNHNNKVFVCGEARTHCVKKSMIDLFEYTRKKSNIILIQDCSSPIEADGVKDDLIPTVIPSYKGTAINSTDDIKTKTILIPSLHKHTISSSYKERPLSYKNTTRGGRKRTRKAKKSGKRTRKAKKSGKRTRRH